MNAEWALLGAALELTLDLDTATYADLRAEFLAMTAAAQRASGQSKAVVVQRCAGRPGKQTVYNYAGGTGYRSFPKPDLLQRYLECCDLPADQIRFAVDRCAQIRHCHPEAGKPGPRKAPPPRPEDRSADGSECAASAIFADAPELPSATGLVSGTAVASAIGSSEGSTVASATSLAGATDLPGAATDFAIATDNVGTTEMVIATDMAGGTDLAGVTAMASASSLSSDTARADRTAPTSAPELVSAAGLMGGTGLVDVAGLVSAPELAGPTDLASATNMASGTNFASAADVASTSSLSSDTAPADGADLADASGFASATDVASGSGLTDGSGTTGGDRLPRAVLPDGTSGSGLASDSGLTGGGRLPRVGLPLSAQSGGWAGRWRGLVRLIAARKIVAAVDGAGEPRFVTPLPSTWYGSRTSEPWQPSEHAPGGQRRDSADRSWGGRELRDSGIRVTPGRLALRIVRAELENAWPRDECNAMELVRKAYATLGIALRTRAGEESGVSVALEQAAPGDILTLVDGRKGLYAGGGWALLLATAADGANLHGIRDDQVHTVHRINWDSVPLTDRPLGWGGVWPNADWVVLGDRRAPSSAVGVVPDPCHAPPSYTGLPMGSRLSSMAAEGEPRYAGAVPKPTDDGNRPPSSMATGELSLSTESVVARYGQLMHAVTEQVEAAGPMAELGLAALRAIGVAVAGYGQVGHRPAPTETGGEPPVSAEAVAARYEHLVYAMSEQVEAAGRAAEPGLAALRAIDGLAFPHPGSQAWLVREAFKAIDLPLPERIRFELPIMAAALRHVPLRPGDIVFTESGVLGFYGERGELVYLGPAGAPVTSALQPALYVAAWRVSAVPAPTGYGLTSKVEIVEDDGTGRLVRIYRAGERRSGRHRRCPETAEVVAMVIVAVERARQRAVPMPLSGRELFTAARIRGGIEFSSTTTAWDPVCEPVYPRDARLTSMQDALPENSATAAQQLMARLETAPRARWSRRPRPGVA